MVFRILLILPMLLWTILTAQIEYKSTINLGPLSGNAGGGSVGMALDESNSRLYTANQNSKNISVIDIETHAVVHSIDLDDYPLDIIPRVINNEIYILGNEGITAINVMDYTLRRAAALRSNWDHNYLDLVQDTLSNTIYYVNGIENYVSYFDIDSDFSEKTFSTTIVPNALYIDYHNNLLILSSLNDHTIEIFDRSTRSLKSAVTLNGNVRRIIYNPYDSNYIAIAIEGNYEANIGEIILYRLSKEFATIDSLVLRSSTIEVRFIDLFYDEFEDNLFVLTFIDDGNTYNSLARFGVPAAYLSQERRVPIFDILWTNNDYFILGAEDHGEVIYIDRESLAEFKAMRKGYEITDFRVNTTDNTIHTTSPRGYVQLAKHNIIDGNNGDFIEAIDIDDGTSHATIAFIGEEYIIRHLETQGYKIDYDTKAITADYNLNDFAMDNFSATKFEYDSTDGILIFSGSGMSDDQSIIDSRIEVLDATSLNHLWTVDIPDDLSKFHNSYFEIEDSSRLLFSLVSGGEGYSDSYIAKINMADFTVIESLVVNKNLIGITISKTKREVIVADYDKIFVYDMDLHLKSEVPISHAQVLKSNLVSNDLYILSDSPSEIAVYDGNSYDKKYSFTINFGNAFDPSDRIDFNYLTGHTVCSSRNLANLYVFEDQASATVQQLEAPNSVSVAVGDNELAIYWGRVTGTMGGYNVYRAEESENLIKINSQLIRDTSFVDLDLVNNIPYHYSIAAMGTFNIEGHKSTPITATPIELPDFQFVPYTYDQRVEPGDTATFTFVITPESQFNDNVSFSVQGLPDSAFTFTSPNNLAGPGEIALSISANNNSDLGTYPFQIFAQGGGQTHIIDLTLIVESQYSLTVHANPAAPFMYESMVLFGQLQPGLEKAVSVSIEKPGGQKTNLSTNSDIEGNYQVEYAPTEHGEHTIYSKVTSLNGLLSDTLLVTVEKARSQISATTDIADTAETGWAMTIKGRVYPPPGASNATLSIMKPDSSEVIINGVLINDEGYYGHNVSADMQGLWRVSASWPGNAEYIGAESNELTVPVGLEVGRAIIVRGSISSLDTTRTTAVDSLIQFTYQVLKARRFTDEMIQFYHPDITWDVNDDGFSGEVDAVPTLAAIEDGILNWAKTAVNDSVALTIYLVGAGEASGGFLVNETETLTPGALGLWLQELIDSTQTTVKVVIESDFAAGFAAELSGPNYITIASTDTTQWVGYDDGAVSFSNYFWNGIFQGMSIGEAYLTTKDAIIAMPEVFANQLPQLEANANLIHNEQADADVATLQHIGGTYLLGNFVPTISGGGTTEGSGGLGKFVDPSLAFESTLARVAEYGMRLWVRISDDADGPLAASMLLFNPDRSFYGVLPLSPSAKPGIYETTLFQFIQMGMYNAFIYATDASGHTTLPIRKQFYLTEGDLDYTPPAMNIGLLQNPILPSYLDLFLISSETLREIPSVSFGGDDVATDQADEIGHLAYSAKLKIVDQGTQTIDVTATDLRGNEASSTYTFSIESLSKDASLTTSVPGSEVAIRFAEGSVYQTTQVRILPIAPSHDYTGLGKIYSNLQGFKSADVVPTSIFKIDIGSQLLTPFTLQASVTESTRGRTFYEVSSGVAVPLTTFTNEMNSMIWAFGAESGIYSIADGPETVHTVPLTFKLNQNYPNPFNASTKINYRLPASTEWNANQPGRSVLDIYNILGKRVTRLVDEVQAPGTYTVTWHGLDKGGRSISSSIYFVRLSFKGQTQIIKTTLLK